MRAAPAINGARGFTLVELLVALAILALLLTLVVSSLRFGANAGASIEGNITVNEHVHLVQRYLRRQLSQIAPPPVGELDNDSNFSFRARADRLEFVAPFAASAAQPGPHRVALAIENDPQAGPGRRRLVLEFLPLSGDPRTQRVRRVLLSGMESARWRYWGADRRGNAHWVDDWRDVNASPGLIHLDLQWPEADGRSWGEFYVAPRIRRGVAHADG